SKPSLLCLTLPTNALHFYHLEQKRLIPATPQLATLNAALRALHATVESTSFEPSRLNVRSSKVLIWSHEWLVTAKLDLEQISRGNSTTNPTSARSLRKKRAREAREQLEAVSLSSVSPSISSTSSVLKLLGGNGISAKSSADDPEFYRISNKFRAVAWVDWLGAEEMLVVERPVADFIGELPPAFWTGGFGRS
ncbi:hypothetical protein P7C73_g5600, partial [Tremellales sp. Uapishka_1]